MTDDLEARRHVRQNLGDCLADLAQIINAAGFADAGWRMNDVAPRQLGWQLAALLPLGFSSSAAGSSCVGDAGAAAIASALAASAYSSATSSCLSARSIFSELAELLALQAGDLGFELLDRQLRDNEAVPGRCQLDVLRNDEPLQLGNIVGELIGRERHAA